MEAEIFVLDSYALLAHLESGNGEQHIGDLLQRASQGTCKLLMSVVNLGEVLYLTERRRGWPKALELFAYTDELPIQVIDANRTQILAAAHIKASWPLAYADCFAAALAKLNGAAVVTGDPEFKQLESDGLISVSWLER